MKKMITSALSICAYFHRRTGHRRSMCPGNSRDATAELKQNRAKRKPLSILVADDDPDTVETLAVVLADEGHTVHKTHRGDHVVECVERYKPRVCIIDIAMPGKSGYAIAQELAVRMGPECPMLIAISGVWTRKSEQLLAEAVGFHRFFTKPADPRELVQFLDEVRSDN